MYHKPSLLPAGVQNVRSAVRVFLPRPYHLPSMFAAGADGGAYQKQNIATAYYHQVYLYSNLTKPKNVILLREA
jgi:hypothetical protein